MVAKPADSKINLPDWQIPSPKRAYEDPPLKIRHVKDNDYNSLLTNIITGLAVFSLLAVPLRMRTGNFAFPFALATSVVAVSFIWTRRRLSTEVPARQAFVYLDSLKKIIVVYDQGFHFVAWYFRKEHDELSFQRDEIITCRKKDGNEIRFRTKDGYEVYVDIQIMFRRRNTPEALSNSLRFQIEQLKDWILAGVKGRLSELGGCNTYEDLLNEKTFLRRLVADLFNGSDESIFEEDTGTDIKDPILENFDLTDESKETIGAKSRIGIMESATRRLLGLEKDKDGNPIPGIPGLDAKDASMLAQVEQGNATRIIHTYEGIPQSGLKVLALGETGVAVAANESGGGRGKGGKGKGK